MKNLIDADIRQYARSHGIGGSEIISKINGELEQLSLPGFQTPYSSIGVDHAMERERAMVLKELQSPQRLAEAFKGGDVISSILPEYIKGNIPSFNIVGAIIDSPEDFAKLTWTLRSPYMELLKVAFLDENRKALHSAILSVGTVNQTLVHPQMILREVQRLAEKTNTQSIILSHNHPSGDPRPSPDDHHATRTLVESLQVANIELLDHVITNGTKFSSWKSGWLISSLETPQPAWEMVSRSDLPKITVPDDMKKIIATLRQADPAHDHVIYGDAKLQVIAVERLPASLSVSDLALRIARGTGREGAISVWFESAQRAQPEVVRLRDTLNKIQIPLLDAGIPTISSFRTEGIFCDKSPTVMREETRISPLSLDAKALQAVKQACRAAMTPQRDVGPER